MDRENELILTDAIRKALPQYMAHPILHLQHTERPVGTVTKAEIDAEGALQIEGSIFETPDTDDVWTDIQKGILNKFSIYGKRDDGTFECKLSPESRNSPCVTKALTLFSISLVGENAMNEKTYLNVAKAGDNTESEEKEVEKCNYPDKKADDLIHEPSNISSVMSRMDGFEKAGEEVGGRLAKIEETLSQLVESDKQVHSEMGKAEDDKLTEKDEKEEKVEKAKVDSEKTSEGTSEKPEFIQKATMESEIKKAVDEVRKAYDEKFSTIEKAHTELKETVEKMKKETIEKGGHVVVISKEQVDSNSKLNQLDMIGSVV